MEWVGVSIAIILASIIQVLAPEVEKKAKKRKEVKFHRTYAWQKERRTALYNQRMYYGFPFNFCEDCGITGNHVDEGGMPVVMTVDHIEPRSKRPDLALDQTNLTILCESCNKAKGVGEPLPR